MFRGLLIALLMGLFVPGKAAGEVFLGSDVLAQLDFAPLRGKRVGLLTNPSGVNRQGQSTVDLLRRAGGVKLAALFAAEHGLYGDIAAGKEFSSHRDPRTGLPVYSLYGPGPTRQPTRSMLQGLDVLVFDIQDTGLRSYTYISTMGLAMEACGAAGVEFMVLDRPNPQGGIHVEGPLVDKRFKSFVGQWPIPYLYGMTCGELARMINGEGWTTNHCRLFVVPMTGWKRDLLWRDTGLRWVPTSPNVPAADTPLYLAATGILGELGGVGIGSGTPFRFQCISAPWLDASRTAQILNAYRLPGVVFRPIVFQKPAGNWVKAVKIDFTSPHQAPKMALNLFLWEAIKRASGHDLFKEAIQAGRSFNMFDKVIGTDWVRRGMEKGQSAASIAASWKPAEAKFLAARNRYLIPHYAHAPAPPATPKGASPPLMTSAPKKR